MWSPFRIDVGGDFLKDDAIKILVDDLAIEIVNVKVQLVGKQFAVGEFASYGVAIGNEVAFFVVYALFTQHGFQTVRRVVVDEIAVNDSLAISVLEDRLAKK